MLAGVGWTSWLWLPRLHLPALILMGADDPIVPTVSGRIIASRLPDARLEIVACGHLFIYPDPPPPAPPRGSRASSTATATGRPRSPPADASTPGYRDRPMTAYTAPV